MQNELIKNENIEMKEEIRKTKPKISKMERQKRRNNIPRYTGLKFILKKKEAQVEEVQNFTKSKIGVDTQIRNTRQSENKITIEE